MLTITLTGRLLLLIAVVVIALGHVSVGAQVRLSPEDAEKLVVEKPEPPYPAIARAAGAKGVVRVEVHVSEEGKVTSATAVGGHPLLQASAASAAKRRSYRPHVVGGKPTAFVTTVDIVLSLDGSPPPSSAEFENDAEVSTQFFKEEGKCRELVKSKTWQEAESVCGSAVKLAEQFGGGRGLEKMGAYEMFGHVMMGRERFKDALDYYDHALKAVGGVIKETDAELARLYGDMAIAHHSLRDLGRAREFYRKAEKTFQLARAHIVKDGPDEHGLWLQRQYTRSLKQLLELHLIAAEDAGDSAESEEVRKLLRSLPD